MSRSNLKSSASLATLAVRAAPSEGQEPGETAYDAKEIKRLYKEATGNDLNVKNNHLLQVINQHPDFDGMDSKQQISFLTSINEQVKGIAIADPQISKLVGKIDKTAETVILETIDRIIRAKASTLDCLAVFRRIYTKDDLAGFAFPGLEKDKMEQGDNRKPDIVTTKLKTTGEEITTVWTDDFCSTWGPCKAWETDMDDLKKELRSSNSVPRFKHLGRQDLTNMLKIRTAERNAFRSMVKRALTFEHQITAIEGMPRVVFEFAQVGTKDTVSKHIALPVNYGLGDKLKPSDCIKVSLSGSPVWLYPKGQAGAMKPFSVTQINNMDIRAAIAAGGEMGDLTDTIKKGPDDSGDDTGTGDDADIDEAFMFTTKTANWFNQRGNVALVRKALSNPKNEDYAEWLQLVGDLAVAVLPIYRRNKSAYEALGNADATSQEEQDAKKTGTND